MDYANFLLKESYYQLNNLWSFSIEKNDEAEWPLFATIVSTSLPLLKLGTETRNTGEKHYIEFSPTDTFSITVRERTDFSTYNYFKEWMDSVFDQDQGVFLSLGSNVEKGSPSDTIHRKGTLVFNTFEEDTDRIEEYFRKTFIKGTNGLRIPQKELTRAVREVIKTQQYDQFVLTSITHQEIIQNIFTALGRQAVGAAASAVNKVQNLGRTLSGRPNKSAGALPAPPTKKKVDIIKSNAGYRIDINRITSRGSERTNSINTGSVSEQENREDIKVTSTQFKEKPTQKFFYEGLKILGIGNVDLSYEEGAPLEYTVELTADRVYPID
jgi:hypothetical protein